ncbi:hypothetical protein [Acidovorax sp. SRB_24]|uniref:hypothetical protein n=1 Tax=Acidovorax sp. SRB_24 TaxID=1962700 RepID=UPI001EB0E620|nr:hypothetical protein [Acidovorax sp. SRB_24]
MAKPGGKLPLQMHYHSRRALGGRARQGLSEGRRRVPDVREPVQAYSSGRRAPDRNPGQVHLEMVDVQRGPISARTTSCVWTTFI